MVFLLFLVVGLFFLCDVLFFLYRVFGALLFVLVFVVGWVFCLVCLFCSLCGFLCVFLGGAFDVFGGCRYRFPVVSVCFVCCGWVCLFVVFLSLCVLAFFLFGVALVLCLVSLVGCVGVWCLCDLCL